MTDTMVHSRSLRAARRASFWQTSLAAAVAAGLVAIGTRAIVGKLGTILTVLVLVVGWTVSLTCVAIAICGWVVLRRDSALGRNKTDLFLAMNKSRSESAIATHTARAVGVIPRIGRVLGIYNGLIVGELVEIRSFDEIARTLDENQTLDGLPFMPEMRQFCGQQARVFRRADKIWDYNRSFTIRRLDSTVLLLGLRCNGSSHDNCEAGCYLIWKSDWLKRPENNRVAAQAGPQNAGSAVTTPMVSTADTFDSLPLAEGHTMRRYRCQYTELYAASTSMATGDRRQDLVPLVSGNVSLIAFLVAIATRIFNRVQRLRGSFEFAMVPPGHLTTTPLELLDLRAGDRVRVRSEEFILATLDAKRRNRGLWFDREMLKHCNKDYRVLRRVERIIDDKTGQMLHMKYPCIVLDGVFTSGEFERFCPQHDLIFWREGWLERMDMQSSES